MTKIYIGVYATPTPAPNILSFLLRRKKKEYWIRKKNNADSKQSLNSTQNSWTRYRSDNTSFFIVSLSDCRLIVTSVNLIRHCEKSLILKQSITQPSSFCHIERKRNISNKPCFLPCMRFFGLRPLNDVNFVNADLFILGFMQPQTSHQIFFLFLAMKKERTLDKKEKQRRLNTVTKFNPKLVNSLPLRQHEFFRCFIKWL